MLTLSPSGRTQTLRIGIICLIFGSGMFISHLFHKPSEPKRFAVNNPAPVVAPPSPNPASAPSRKQKKVLNESAPPARSGASAPAPIVAVAPPAPQWFDVSSSDVLRALGNVTLVPTQISTAGDTTRIKLAVDSQDAVKGRICKLFVNDDSRKLLFLLDEQGKRYNLVRDENRYSPSNCVDFAPMERILFEYGFEKLDPGVQRVTLFWNAACPDGRRLTQKTVLNWQGRSVSEETSVPARPQPTQLQVSVPPPITLPHGPLVMQIEGIEVDQTGTKVHFRITGSGARNSRYCNEGPTGTGGIGRDFLTDDQGRRYANVITLGDQRCPQEPAQGEVQRFTIVFQRLNLPTNTVIVHWGDLYNPSVVIPVRVRQ